MQCKIKYISRCSTTLKESLVQYVSLGVLHWGQDVSPGVTHSDMMYDQVCCAHCTLGQDVFITYSGPEQGTSLCVMAKYIAPGIICTRAKCITI